MCGGNETYTEKINPGRRRVGAGGGEVADVAPKASLIR